MEIRRRAIAFYHNVFNLQLACISAAWNGSWILFFNGSYGWEAGKNALIAQMIMSFFFTGFTGRLVQHFSPLPFWPAYILGSLVPASVTFVLVGAIHLLIGTPALLWSVVEPTLTSVSSSLITNILTRRNVRIVLPGNYPAHKN